MTRLRLAGLLLVPALVLVSSPARAAKPQSKNEKVVPKPVPSLAMDGSRVVYMRTDRKVAVWNVSTGRTTVIKGTYPSNGHGFGYGSGEVAIAGTRVALITRFVTGNSQQTQERLYTAKLGGTAHQLGKLTNHYTNPQDGEPDGGLSYGTWLDGVVGSGKTLAVSSWKSVNSVPSNERLSLVTPTGLHAIATDTGAVVSTSANSGHIAVFRSRLAWPADDVSPTTIAPTAGIYSSSGALLNEIALPGSAYEIALSGNELVVLTETIPHPGSLVSMLQVYNWTTGQLTHTYPVSLGHVSPGADRLAAYGQFAAIEGPSELHVVDLKTGKDVTLAPSSRNGCPPAIGPRGLVFALNPTFKGHATLIFVPMRKLRSDLAASG
jgi:hypothetical protein